MEVKSPPEPSNMLVNKRNFRAFLWHAAFLALATTFTDVNTILPSMIVSAGGTDMQIGLLTAIMVGTPILGQLAFASYLHLKPRKKGFLLLGINLRVIALAMVAVVMWNMETLTGSVVIGLVMVLMFVFAIAGTFAGVSYTDILGKSLPENQRPRFFVSRQVVNSVGILVSALIASQLLGQLEYPSRYVWLFGAASLLLLFASLGFWALEEEPAEVQGDNQSVFQVLKSIPGYIRTDRGLRDYIYLINLTGFGLTLMPFYVAIIKTEYGLTGQQVGAYLLANIFGMIASNFIWAKVVKQYGFRGVVRGCIICGAVLPLLALILIHGPAAYFLIVFFLMGVAISARKIAFEGLFLEITTKENRALHNGVVGAMSLSTALFPLAAGGLIGVTGYAPVFILGSILVASAYRFAGPIRSTNKITP